MLQAVHQMLRRLFPDRRGFTLVEVAVALAILSMGATLVGGAVFQTLSIQRFWQDDVKANKDSRHAASWFAEDALRATATSLEDGETDVTVTITTESVGAITYVLSGSNLVRDFDGSQNVVAEKVVSVEFALSEQMLTFTLQVEASRGGTETLTLKNYLRLLDS